MPTRPGWPYKKEFECHRCGNCCRGDGFVDMTEQDIAAAAAHLSLTREAFLAEYCLPGSDGYILRDQDDEAQSCIFLTVDERGLSGCRIHAAKPSQCSAFPFQWRPRNVLSFCDGMRALEGLRPVGNKSSMSPKGKDER